MYFRRRERLALTVLLLTLMLPLLGCEWLFKVAASPQTSSTVPRWTCPTPTPKPFGEAGPVKGSTPGAPDPTSGIPVDEPTYYQQWEQEDFDGGGAPFPSPTPDTKSGTVFFLGQLVNLGDGSLDVQPSVAASSILSGTEQLYIVTLIWHNRGQPVPFVAARQIAINEVTQTSGRKATNTWITSEHALRLAGVDTSTVVYSSIPAGTTEQRVPIFAPRGTVETVELRLDLAGQAEGLRVRFIKGAVGTCAAPGTENAGYAQPANAAIPPAVPPGADSVVAFALKQIGRPYCWGGKGYSPCDGYGGAAKQVTPSCAAQGGSPCWDCSGLTWGSYNSQGVVIGQGTGNQSRYPVISIADIQPGDLMLFSDINAQGRGARITHVGLYAGDVNGDGTGDLVHAANYPDGVIITNNVLGNRYYQAHLVVVTRPPRS